MKFNWKVALAAVVVVGTVFWAVTSLRSNSYDAANLNFGVGSGVVSLTNTSGSPVAVQLVGSGSRTFTVASETAGMSGVSVREGSGSTSTQTFAFDLPSGASEFSVLRGSNVQFVSPTDTRLQAVSNPLSSDLIRTTQIASLVVIIGALFFMSNETSHAMIRGLIGRPLVVPVAVVDTTGGQGRETRSYGDNRANK